MTRYIKPDSGAVAKFSEKIVESGDGAWYPVVGSLSTLAGFSFAVLGVFGADNPVFGLLILPGLFFLLSIFSYITGTEKLGFYSNNVQYYKSARYKYWPQLENTELASMAKPLMVQIFNCTKENHPGTQYGKNCKLCIERSNAMKELVPNKPSDLSDLNTVKRYLEMRNEAEAEHAKAMKELMP